MYQCLKQIFEVSEILFMKDINWDIAISVVGGLLSAHLLSKKAEFELNSHWPCEGPLLDLAVDVARRLLPAFQTPTGMPYGTVNLRHGVPPNETPVTCSAGVGTFLLEFASISRLTGDPIFEQVAIRAIKSLHKTRSHIDLLGNHINTSDGKWTAIDATIGAGVDSFFEYLVKGSMLLHDPEFLDMFYVYYDSANKYMKRDDWFFVVHKDNGQVTLPIFQSLEAFWPGLLTLIGDVEQAKKSILNYHQIARQYGFLPESYDVSNSEVKRGGYPLRPEYVESLFYLYRSTRDPHILMMAAEVIESIEKSTKTSCGYATVKDVETHTIEDRMESFFLAETLKYLYLIFSDDTHFINNPGSNGKIIKIQDQECVVDAGGYVFNTEAHPIDISLVDCCTKIRSYSPPIPLQISRGNCSISILDRFARIVSGLDLEQDRKRSIYCDSQYSCDPDLLSCETPRLNTRLHLMGQVN